jgi:hypothetical protein
MAKKSARRFGLSESTKATKAKAVHVAPPRHLLFVGELELLANYLDARIMPREPEDAYMSRLLLTLQNILEYELERAIGVYVNQNPTARNTSFLNKIQTDFVTFKVKFTWARARGIISVAEHDTMEEVRVIRNDQTHLRPTSRRPKFKYRGKPLLTRVSVAALFGDLNAIVIHLRNYSGSAEKWELIPPGYAEEMGW